MGFTPFFTGQIIKTPHGKLAGVDRIFTKFQLDSHFDKAADDNDPEGDEAGLGS